MSFDFNGKISEDHVKSIPWFDDEKEQKIFWDHVVSSGYVKWSHIQKMDCKKIEQVFGVKPGSAEVIKEFLDEQCKLANPNQDAAAPTMQNAVQEIPPPQNTAPQIQHTLILSVTDRNSLANQQQNKFLGKVPQRRGVREDEEYCMCSSPTTDNGLRAFCGSCFRMNLAELNKMISKLSKRICKHCKAESPDDSPWCFDCHRAFVPNLPSYLIYRNLMTNVVAFANAIWPGYNLLLDVKEDGTRVKWIHLWSFQKNVVSYKIGASINVTPGVFIPLIKEILKRPGPGLSTLDGFPVNSDFLGAILNLFFQTLEEFARDTLASNRRPRLDIVHDRFNQQLHVLAAKHILGWAGGESKRWSPKGVTKPSKSFSECRGAYWKALVNAVCCKNAIEIETRRNFVGARINSFSTHARTNLYRLGYVFIRKNFTTTPLVTAYVTSPLLAADSDKAFLLKCVEAKAMKYDFSDLPIVVQQGNRAGRTNIFQYQETLLAFASTPFDGQLLFLPNGSFNPACTVPILHEDHNKPEHTVDADSQQDMVIPVV